MFRLWKHKKSAREARLAIFEKMKEEQDSKKWEQLKTQYDTYDKMENPRGRVCMGDIFGVVSSLLSILLVLHYEKLDNITSKCWNWIRPKKL